MASFTPNSSRGSLWHRWEPHTHTPGTKLNDQFSGLDPWEDFLSGIEGSDPIIRALGVTDYYDLEPYERVLQYKAAGRLPDVALVFANVELRLSVGTVSGKAVNAHLLVSPEDPAHVSEVRAFLAKFEFEHARKKYRCDRDGLIRLGRAFDSTVSDDATALSVGTNQFKISYEELRDYWRESPWARENILIAVSGGADGTSGLKKDASLSALRESIENLAHVIFASHAQQVAFWLGRGPATIEDLENVWGGLKPCLHGADAHSAAKVGNPDDQRFSWIRGDVTFEALRQSCIEPENRVHIGATPPPGPYAARSIASISVDNAPWIRTGPQSLNSGLVAVIGARGSGKTALADLIAAGAYALRGQLDKRSFIVRAEPFLRPSTVALEWEDGSSTQQPLASVEPDDVYADERVQYLSQHFVDQLCSAEGERDALISEIERIVFQKHTPSERQGATSFLEMREHRCEEAKSGRSVAEGRIADLSVLVELEQEKQDGLAALKSGKLTRTNLLAREKAERDAIIKRGRAGDAERLTAVSNAAEQAQLRVDAAERRQRALVGLQTAAKQFNARTATDFIASFKRTHASASLTEEQWKSFEIRFVGDVDQLLAEELATAGVELKRLSGEPIAPPSSEAASKPLVGLKADLSKQPLSILIAERERLQKLSGLDAENAKALRAVDSKIAQSNAALQKIDVAIADAEAASSREAVLRAKRTETYSDVFTAILQEHSALEQLYRPVRDVLEGRPGTLGKLAFSVERLVDVEGWADRGLSLLDLRRGGTLRGRNALRDAAAADLLPAWKAGTPDQVAEAMAAFRSKYQQNFLDQCPVDRKDRPAVRDWARAFSSWLYSTDHLRVAYGITYDGVPIEQLSSGTRGIVLLLLFLALDTDDLRPLIIDQPEENLDPKSIYDELVPLFREAKQRRQIIIVTHNANLVVNTDADQVIVATSGVHSVDRLPEIEYESGGLENPAIRALVCKILEGGEKAFIDRARRLRVNLSAA